MKVRRIVANIHSTDLAGADAFYREVLGLELAMDHGFFRTYVSGETMTVQVGIGTEGGAGTPIPDLSIEVDDLAQALARIKAAGIGVEYGPTSEPWGVRRFFVRDPMGKLVNILQHEPPVAPTG